MNKQMSRSRKIFRLVLITSISLCTLPIKAQIPSALRARPSLCSRYFKIVDVLSLLTHEEHSHLLVLAQQYIKIINSSEPANHKNSIKNRIDQDVIFISGVLKARGVLKNKEEIKFVFLEFIKEAQDFFELSSHISLNPHAVRKNLLAEQTEYEVLRIHALHQLKLKMQARLDEKMPELKTSIELLEMMHPHSPSAAFAHAARDYSFEHSYYFLSKGANIDAVHIDQTALMSLLAKKDYRSAEIIIQLGANLDIRNQLQETALTRSIVAKDMVAFHLLLRHGAKLDITDNDGYAALDIALTHRNPEALKLLLEAGAAMENTDNITRLSTLERAILNEYLEEAQILLDSGANREIVSMYGSTLLMSQVTKKNLKTISLLLQARADVNATNAEGYTPLMYAVLARYSEGIQILLNAGANPKIQNKDGLTAYRLAKQMNFEEGLELLASFEEASVAPKNKAGTP